MERRQFLQGVVVLGAASLLPAAVGVTGPSTAAELTAAIERMFTARIGPPMAFFMLGTGAAQKQYVYKTIAVGVEGGAAADAERALAQHLYEEFRKIPPGPLVWRKQPEFQSDEIPVFGEIWMTAEQFEDASKQPAVPDNVALDHATGHWRYVTGVQVMHRMRMRIVLPHVADGQLQEIVKQEGEATPRKG